MDDFRILKLVYKFEIYGQLTDFFIPFLLMENGKLFGTYFLYNAR